LGSYPSFSRRLLKRSSENQTVPVESSLQQLFLERVRLFTPENVKLVTRKLNIKNVAFLVRSFWRVNRMKAEQRIIVRKRRVVSESCFKQTNSNQAAKKSHPKDSTLYNLLSRFSLFGDVSIYKR